MSRVQIRRAAESDASALAELILSLAIMPWIKAEGKDAVLAIVSGKLRAAQDSTTIMLAESPAGALLGYGSVTWVPNLLLPGMEGYVSELFIAENRRGFGIGTEILNAMEALAVERGCSRLSLLNLDNRESYHRSFYPKRGWEERASARNMIKHIGKSASRN